MTTPEPLSDDLIRFRVMRHAATCGTVSLHQLAQACGVLPRRGVSEDAGEPWTATDIQGAG